MISANIGDQPDDFTALDGLIARISRADQTALAELYSETRSAVYGFSLSILQNAHDAEDVLQDTYIRVWSSAASYSSQGKPMAWLLTIAKNLSRSKLRDRVRVSDMDDEQWQLFYAENPAVTSEDRLVLDAALRGLGEQERQIVMLHAVTGFKHAEIAAMLDMPISTVLSKYSRARKKLQALIGGELI